MGNNSLKQEELFLIDKDNRRYLQSIQDSSDWIEAEGCEIPLLLEIIKM